MGRASATTHVIGAAAQYRQNVINGRRKLPEGEMAGIRTPVGLKRELVW